jgi:hypothetical protein
MSTVSAAGNAGQDLYSFLRSVSGNTPAPATQQATSGGAVAAADPSQAAAPGAAAADPAASSQPAGVRHHRHHHGGGGGFRAKIESAVSSALQSAKSSGDSTDVNQVIQDAISKVLKDGPGNSPAAGGPSQAAGNAANSAPATGTGQDADATSGPSDPSSTSGQTDTFAQLLQQYGVSHDQFRSDLQAAFQNANGGAPDLSSAFKRFPPGIDLDTHA